MVSVAIGRDASGAGAGALSPGPACAAGGPALASRAMRCAVWDGLDTCFAPLVGQVVILRCGGGGHGAGSWLAREHGVPNHGRQIAVVRRPGEAPPGEPAVRDQDRRIAAGR